MTSPITPKDDELIERLTRRDWVNNGDGGNVFVEELINPDGPAAASRIAELKTERERREDLLFRAMYGLLHDVQLGATQEQRVQLAREIRDEVSALSNPPSGEVS